MADCSGCRPQTHGENNQLKFVVEYWESEFGHVFDHAIMWDALARDFIRLNIMSEDDHRDLLKGGSDGLATNVYQWIVKYLTQQQCDYIKDNLIKHLYLFVVHCTTSDFDVWCRMRSKMFYPDRDCKFPLMDWPDFAKTKEVPWEYPKFENDEMFYRWHDALCAFFDREKLDKEKKDKALNMHAFYKSSPAMRATYRLGEYYK